MLTIKLIFDHLRNLTNIQLAKNLMVVSYPLKYRETPKYFQFAPCQRVQSPNPTIIAARAQLADGDAGVPGRS